MFDITLIETIYNLLSNLELDGFIAYSIKLKVVRKNRNGLYFVNFNDKETFYNTNKDIIDNNKPNRYCQVGDYTFIENIKFTNTNTNYSSEYFYYNITDGVTKIVDKIKYDTKRNEFYEADKNKYIAYLKTSLIENNDKLIQLADTRLSSYVDACYVKPGYVGEAIRVTDSIKNDLV